MVRPRRLLYTVALLLAATPAGAAPRPPAPLAPFVVRYTVEGQGHCSAVLVGPSTALTAAHCVIADEERQGRVAGVPIAAARVHPTHDIAILALSGSLPGPHARWTPEPLPPAQLVHVVGYGCSVRVRVAVTVGQLDDIPPRSWRLRGHGCHGDSGGAVLDLGGRLRAILWGVSADHKWIVATNLAVLRVGR